MSWTQAMIDTEGRVERSKVTKFVGGKVVIEIERKSHRVHNFDEGVKEKKTVTTG